MKAAHPDLPPQCFVQYGNFIGETLEKLASANIPHIIMGIMLGKAVKLAEGNMDTHSKKVTMNKQFLHDIATQLACTDATHEVIERITLARELWTELAPSESEKLLMYITQTCHKVSQRICPNSKLTVLLIDDEGNIRYSAQ